MGINAEDWTQNKIFQRIRKDLDLEGEDFFRAELMEEALNSAITDCEELVINQYSDYLLTYQDYDLTANQSYLSMPTNIYQSRVRWIHFRKSGFTNLVSQDNAEAYKLKKIPLEQIQDLTLSDAYQYRILNDVTNGPLIYIFPYVRSEDSGTARIRVWYIRRFKRLFELSDVTDIPVPEYLLAHLRCQIMFKEGNPMLSDAENKLAFQTQRLINTVKMLTDDEEDSLLEPNYLTLDTFGEQHEQYY